MNHIKILSIILRRTNTLIKYDNKLLSGAQVSEAITKFKGKKVAILLATPLVMDGTTAFNTPDGNIPQIHRQLVRQERLRYLIQQIRIYQAN